MREGVGCGFLLVGGGALWLVREGGCLLLEGLA